MSNQVKADPHPMVSREPYAPHTQHAPPQPTSILEGASRRLRALRDEFDHLTQVLQEYGDRTFGVEPPSGTAVGKETPAPVGAVATVFDDIDNLDGRRIALAGQIERFRSLA